MHIAKPRAWHETLWTMRQSSTHLALALSALMMAIGACGDPHDFLELDSPTGGELGESSQNLAIGEPAPGDRVPIPICSLFGTCPSGSLFVSGYTPLGLAANSLNVFWSVKSTSEDSAPVMFKKPAAGGAVTEVFSDISAASAGSLVLDNSRIYWLANRQGKHALWFAPEAGGAATRAFGPSGLDYGVAPMQGLALVPRRPVFGPGTFLAFPPTVSLLMAVPDVALWKVSKPPLSLSWTSTSIAPPIAPGEIYYPETVTSNTTTAFFIGDRIYPDVWRVSLSGGAPTKLAEASPYSPLATYDSQVYYVRDNDILSVPVDGGAESIFASDVGAPTTFYVDGGNLYWTCTSCGTISKKAFAGGAVTPVAWRQRLPKFVAVSAERVYWGVTNGIRYTAK